MRNPLDHFWARAKELSLTSTEKSEGRAMFQAGMRLTSEAEGLMLTRKERAEGFDRLASALTDKPILRETLWDKFVDVINSSIIRVPVTAAFIFVIGTGALAAAAENALPGDPLYPIKISLTEPLLGRFQHFNKQQEAEWSMVLLERRLDEYEAIATTPNARKQVDPAAKALREQTSEFLNAIDTMLPGEANEELRRMAVREFDARANHVTSRSRNDPTAHEIIRALLDEQRRIEKASRSSSSSVKAVIRPPSTATGSVRSSQSSSDSGKLPGSLIDVPGQETSSASSSLSPRALQRIQKMKQNSSSSDSSSAAASSTDVR